MMKQSKTSSHKGAKTEKTSVASSTEEFKKFITDKSVVVISNGYSSYDIYSMSDDLSKFSLELDTTNELFASMFYEMYLFQFGWHPKLSYDFVEHLLLCKESLCSMPPEISTIFVMLNKNIDLVLKQIFSSPVDSRQKLLDDYFNNQITN